jgi:hypothetical protein
LYFLAVARLIALLVLLVSCGSPFPPAVVPDRPSVAEWPDTGAVVLEDEASLEYIVDPLDPRRVRAVLDHRRRLKILAPEGLAAAEVELYSDELSTVGQIIGRSVQPGGGTVELETLSRTPLADAPGVRGVGRVSFTIPGAVVGGLVEYRYQRNFADPDLVPAWVFGGRYPVFRSELSLVFPQTLRIDFRFGRGERVEEVLPLRRPLHDGRERLVFVVQDLPAFYGEAAMPHPARVQPWLSAVVTANTQASPPHRLETWDDVRVRLQTYFTPVGGAAGAGPVPARYRAVRNAISVIARPGIGVRRPISAERLLAHEPAASRDAVALLLNTLSGSGAEAYPALVSARTGENVQEGFPTLAPFVRAVVAVRASDEAADRTGCTKSLTDVDPVCRTRFDDFIFLDPSCSHCRYGELPWDVAGGRALVLAVDGPQWVDLPLDPPEQHRASIQYRLSFDVNGVLAGSVEGQLSGNIAAPARKLVTMPAGEARDRAFSSLVVGEGEAPLIDVEITAAVNVDQPLSFDSGIRGRIDKLGYERFMWRPSSILGPAFPEYLRSSNRRTPALLDAPRSVEHIVLLEMPVGYEIELPPQVHLARPFAEYSAGFERRERVLTYVRRLRVLQRIITQEMWEEFALFLKDVATVESQVVRIVVRH